MAPWSSRECRCPTVQSNLLITRVTVVPSVKLVTSARTLEYCNTGVERMASVALDGPRARLA
jgi:hypothetical protein